MPTSPSLSERDIWATEVHSGRLPRVCVKSGKAACGNWLVHFENSSSDAMAALIPGKVGRPGGPMVVRAQLPFSTLHSLLIIVARLGFAAALCAWAYGLWNLFTTSVNFATLLTLLGGFGLMKLYLVLRTWFEPGGMVYRAPSGDLWVHMSGVHPNFVAAVEAWRSAENSGSPGLASGENQRRLSADEGVPPG